MITIYAPDETDFSTNGLGLLLPEECLISEEAGGAYELSLRQPISDDLRWRLIADGCLIKAPVPAAETPNIRLVKEGIPAVPATPGTPAVPAVPAQPGRVIWRVNITTSGAGGVSRIYERANTESRVLQKLRQGTEYEYLGPYSANWHRAVSAEGVSGFMYTANSLYVRTEAERGGIPAVAETPGRPGQPAVPGYSTVVGPRQIREQLFRVYLVETDTEAGTVRASARHISYGLADNLCGDLALEEVPLPIALEQLKAGMLSAESRELICNTAVKISGEWHYENGLKVLLDPEDGFVRQARCQVVRDNEDFFLLENKGYDRRVSLRHGKNIKGVRWSTDSDSLVTRIVPVGQDEEGNPIILPEKFVDSPYIDSYPMKRMKRLPVSEARVTKPRENPGPDEPAQDMTLEQAREAMRAAALAEFEAGCDRVGFELEVDFVQLGDTEEYAQYKQLQQIFLYDRVSIYHGPAGLEAQAQVKGYTWDAVTGRYTGMSVGDVFKLQAPTVAGYELGSWSIGGSKIAPGSVGSGQLRDLSVVSAKIGHAVIESEHVGLQVVEKSHLKEALVEDLKADAIEAVRAHIEQLIADRVEADELYAKLAEFVVANITTGNLEQANIQWADIESLKAAMVDAFRARIEYLIAHELVTDELYAALATIATAKIGTAEIDWAKIKDLVSGRQIFEQGVGGKLYIADLAVTEGNMVSLTVGELIVRGADGRFYSVSVDEEGEVVTQLKQIGNGDVLDGSIHGGEKIIEGSITASRLNAQDIFADSAIIRQLMAQHLDADVFFAREGVISLLTLDRLQPLNEAIEMRFNDFREDVDGEIERAVNDVQVGGRNYLLDSRKERGFTETTTTSPFGEIETTMYTGSNLLLNSNFIKGASEWPKSGTNIVSVTDGFAGNGLMCTLNARGTVHPRQVPDFTLLPSGRYWAQAKIKTDDHDALSSSGFVVRIANLLTLEKDLARTKDLGNGWKQYYFTANVPNDLAVASSNVFGFYQGPTGLVFTLDDLKLEKEEEPTSYSPSPNDFSSLKGSSYSLTEPLRAGEWYSLSVNATLTEDSYLGLWAGESFAGYLKDGKIQFRIPPGGDEEDTLTLKSIDQAGVISHAKLERGNKATDWTPAPEDVEGKIGEAVRTIDVEYYLSDSPAELSGGAWASEAPPWVSGKYYWSRNKTSYVSGASVYSAPACITGPDGMPGESVYKVEIVSERGIVFKNGIIQTTLQAIVYEGDDEVTESLDANQFRWTRISDDPAGDAIWNAAHFGGVKEIEVTREDVSHRATFRCEIMKA